MKQHTVAHADILGELISKQIPETADILRAVVKGLGGAEAIGREIAKDYMTAPVGSAQRVRMQQWIVEGLAKLRPEDSEPGLEDDPEECIAIVAELLRGMSLEDRKTVRALVGEDADDQSP